ncbi:MAG: hypothetical protein M1826_002638 [Phylliscum demangeonii]|nr:MAG: hypothetical protein M1826_002638 [Phylliscum demangeonii]
MTKRREANYLDVGVQGRKTGIRLKEGRRDEHGLELIDGIFSSPAVMSAPAPVVVDPHLLPTATATATDSPPPPPAAAVVVTAESESATITTTLDQAEPGAPPDPEPDPDQTRSRPPSVPRARSPIKTHLQSPPRRPPSTGRSQSPVRHLNGRPKRGFPHPSPAVRRRLNFAAEGDVPDVPHLSASLPRRRSGRLQARNSRAAATEDQRPLVADANGGSGDRGYTNAGFGDDDEDGEEEPLQGGLDRDHGIAIRSHAPRPWPDGDSQAATNGHPLSNNRFDDDGKEDEPQATPHRDHANAPSSHRRAYASSSKSMMMVPTDPADDSMQLVQYVDDEDGMQDPLWSVARTPQRQAVGPRSGSLWLPRSSPPLAAATAAVKRGRAQGRARTARPLIYQQDGREGDGPSDESSIISPPRKQQFHNTDLDATPGRAPTGLPYYSINRASDLDADEDDGLGMPRMPRTEMSPVLGGDQSPRASFDGEGDDDERPWKKKRSRRPEADDEAMPPPPTRPGVGGGGYHPYGGASATTAAAGPAYRPPKPVYKMAFSQLPARVPPPPPSTTTLLAQSQTLPLKRGRGRPKGSKNKPKERGATASAPPPATEPWETEPGIVNGPVKLWDSELQSSLDYFIEDEIAYSGSAIDSMLEVVNGSFRFAKTLTLPFFAAGLVELPPGGVKRPKNAGLMQMVFFVAQGKVAVDVGGTPFRIGRGGMWQVPRGTVYGFANDGRETAKLFFTQGCEMMAVADDEDAREDESKIEIEEDEG